MKIEPVATVSEVHMSRYTLEWTNGPLPEGDKLYTAAQMRQLGEACAVLVETQYSTKDEQTYGWIAGESIRELIAEVSGLSTRPPC